MNVHAYGSDVALDGTTLTVTATGRAGRGALGSDQRTVDVARLQALSLKLGNPATNGRLELVDERGKTVIHFRRKTNDEMTALFVNSSPSLPPAPIKSRPAMRRCSRGTKTRPLRNLGKSARQSPDSVCRREACAGATGSSIPIRLRRTSDGSPCRTK
jgi:hypothetical protein